VPASTPPAARDRSGPVDLRLAGLLAAYAVLLVAANLGTILTPSLIDDFPGALLAMGARNRVLLLAIGAGIGGPAYFAIGFVRLLLPALVLYALGWHYGEVGRRWLAGQYGGELPRGVARTERWFDRARYPVIAFFVGSNIVAVLAGLRRVPTRAFLAVFVAGTIARLVFFWYLGQALKAPLDWVLDWLQRLQWPLTALAVVLVAVQMRGVARRAEGVAEEVLDGPPYGDLDRPTGPEPEAPNARP
jgi:membrane protein DedA with SNARE-associated domain